MGYFEQTVDSELIFKGRVVTLKKDSARLDNGKVVSREVIEHSGGVGIVPIDDNGYVYMVRQFRYPLQKELLEIPAGKLEYGEDPAECAVRELSEETGCTAEKMIYLGAVYSSPGFCDEILHIYLALGLTQGEAHLDEDEFLSVEKVHIDKLIDMMMTDDLKDGKTVVGLLKAKVYLER